MKRENIVQIMDELALQYTDATCTEDGGKSLVRLPKVFFPEGCTPVSTVGLVVFDEQQPTPQLLIKEVPKLANGASPRSVSAIAVAGESWYTFSFNQPWVETASSALQFVEGRLRRFALNE